MQSIRNSYRTSDIHDVMEIVRNPNCEFDPEPSTLPAVGDFGLMYNGFRSLQRSVKSMAMFLPLWTRMITSILTPSTMRNL